VAKFRIDSVAALARQLEYAPHDTRTSQVAAAEELLHTIDPAKAYPLEFVVFRITGYRPKTVGEDLLTGIALQHDLGLLIEYVSDSLDVRAASLSEPVLTIEDVGERFNVTSKTIQRWRRRGLPARRFVLPDGKRRVGFLVSSVERFFSTHRDQVTAGMNFSQVDDAERAEILRRARRLAVYCGCCATAISRRIARRLNRTPATVLHTIRKYDQENPDAAIFPQAPAEITDEQRTRILRGHRRGLPLSALAHRVCRPRQAVYRVVLEERIAHLNRRKVKFIDDTLYHEPGADEAIEAILAQHDVMSGGAGASAAEALRVPRDLPPYLQALYRTPLLTPPRERALFLAFNYHKFRFVTARRRLDPEVARARDLAELEGHQRRATEIKNQIVQANLRLVVSVARRHLRPNLSLMELISDGNITLVRAVESFDVHKGNRFSTYATFALMKGFARSVPEMLSAGRRTGSGGGDEAQRMLAQVPDASAPGRQDRLLNREQVEHLLSRLDDRERRVVLAHYGLDLVGTSAVPAATFEQVGERLGLSKQRVRQIEQTAMAKLRAAIGEAEALTPPNGN
jgi:RNA polymerase sigma factor (sigma-70 family)